MITNNLTEYKYIAKQWDQIRYQFCPMHTGTPGTPSAIVY